MKRAEQLQAPIDRDLEVEIRARRVVDPVRALRIATILQKIMDNANAPGEARRS